MIEAQEMEECGVQVVDVDAIFGGFEAEVVRRAMDISAADTATGQQRGETPVIVIATVDFAGIRTLFG